MPPLLVKRLEEIKDLPPMPNTLHRVLMEMDRVTSSGKSLEKIIKEDPMLAAKILRIANSPFYGLVRQVNSIAHAITILGFDEIRNLVLGLSLTQAFGFNNKKSPVPMAELWLHSMAVATASSWLVNEMNGNQHFDQEEFFTMGLLHDIGRFIICNFFSKDLKDILDFQEKEKCTLAYAEEQYGLSHAEVGAYLATKWGLGERMVNVIRYHHYPKSAGDDLEACSVVFLADQLCHKLNIGWSNKWQDKTIKIPKILSLSKDQVKNVAKRMKSQSEELKSSWLSAVGG